MGDDSLRKENRESRRKIERLKKSLTEAKKPLLPRLHQSSPKRELAGFGSLTALTRREI